MECFLESQYFCLSCVERGKLESVLIGLSTAVAKKESVVFITADSS